VIAFKRITSIIIIAFLAITVSACKINLKNSPLVSVKDITKLTLDTRKESPLFLSPDGQNIAWLGLLELCVFNVEQQTKTCTEAKSISDERSLRWSPDSNLLTYTESFITSGHDADIWIYDLQNNTTSNLTDDNFDANTFDENVTSDVIPHWFLNSQEIAFVRYYKGDDPSILHIMTVNKNDNQTNQIIQLDSGFYLPVQSLDTSGDNLIAFNQLCDFFNCDESQQGIWVVDTNRHDDPRRILWLPPQQGGSAFQLQFSATGEYLSACAFYIELIESDKGCQQIIVEVEGEDNDPFKLPIETEAVIWSPTSNAFLAIINDLEEPGISG
jgi:hypothetical protein